jgi:hypothetical protein
MSKMTNWILSQQETGKEPLTEAQEAQNVVKDDWAKEQEADPGYHQWLADYNQLNK